MDVKTYTMKKKIIRLLLDFDFFEDLDLQEFLESKFIIKEKVNLAVIGLIRDILKESKLHRAQSKFEELKESLQRAKYQNVINEDFEITTKPYADYALRMQLKRVEDYSDYPHGSYKLDPEVASNKYRDVNQLVAYEKEDDNFKNIQPSEAQRFYVYIKINVDDKEAVINRLKKVFPPSNIVNELARMKLIQRKMKIYEMLVAKYNELKEQETEV